MTADERIVRIERELRVWRVLAGGMLTVLFLVAAGERPEVLRVQKLIVGDEANGVVISSDKNVASIYVTQSEGVGSNVWISASSDGTADFIASGAVGSATVRSDKLASAFNASAGKESDVSLVAGDGFQSLDLKGTNGKVSATPFRFDLVNERKGRISLDMTFGPALRVEDASGYSSVVGSVDLEDPRTGEKSTTSAASLRLFAKGGQTLWAAR